MVKGRVPGDDKLANSPPYVGRGVPTVGQASPSLVKKRSNKRCKTCHSLVTGPTFLRVQLLAGPIKSVTLMVP